MNIPAHVKRFRNLLLNNALKQLDLELGKKIIHGQIGISTNSHIQYNMDDRNILGRNLEYTFDLPKGQHLEVSLQLYCNALNHWRLFAFCKNGLLLSVNLTLLREKGAEFTIYQTIKLLVKSMSKSERASRNANLCRTLHNAGLEIDENNRLILGTFNSAQGVFVDTSPKVFLRSFITASLLKGHYMGNKGYSLPAFPQKTYTCHTVYKGRSIPLGQRYKILEQYNFKCKACGKGPKDGVKLHVDHCKPISQGGRTELSNLQVLCAICNLGKGNRSVKRIE